MATRQKTVEYAFPLSTAIVATAVARDMTQITIHLPESGKVFRSVVLEVFALQASTTAANVTAFLTGIQLGAVGRSDATVTSTITNSGENQSFLWSRDVTSYFVTNWAGTSMTSDARLTVTGQSTNNVCVKLLITYDYDDTSATQIKTVRIPIEPQQAVLTATFQSVGGVSNNIPALDTFLPEAGKVYRDIFLETTYNEGTTAAQAPNPTLDLRWDGATTVSDGPHEDALASARFAMRRDTMLGSLNTASTATLDAQRGGTTSMPFPGIVPVVVVTYEFDVAASTTIMNSIMIPLFAEAGFVGGNTTADKTRFTRDLFVEEPGTITLVQSAVLITLNDSAAISLDVRAGAQPSRVYAANAATNRCGGISVGRRLDSGAVGGAGMTLARGLNELTLDIFRTSTAFGSLGSNLSAAAYINYTSGKSTLGPGAHARTTFDIAQQSAAITGLRETAASAPGIPSSEYWIVAVGMRIAAMTSGTLSRHSWQTLHAEVLGTEGDLDGWRLLYAGTINTDAEIGPTVSFGRAGPEFKRFPEDPDPQRMLLTASRKLRWACAPTGFLHGYWLVTLHNLVTAKTGAITNYAGTGGGIEVNVHRSDTDELVRTVTTAIGGTFGFSWYDDTVPLYAHARETSARRGRSDDTLGALDIDFLAGGGGGGGELFTGSILNRGINE